LLIEEKHEEPVSSPADVLRGLATSIVNVIKDLSLREEINKFLNSKIKRKNMNKKHLILQKSKKHLIKSIKLKSITKLLLVNILNPNQQNLSQQPAMFNKKKDKLTLNLRIKKKKNLLDFLKIRVRFKKLIMVKIKQKQNTHQLKSIKKKPLKRRKKKLRLKMITLKILPAIKKSRGY